MAEDHPVNRAVIACQLRHLGHAATLVEDGQQALYALAHDRYDLLLTDCGMPLLDGYALARTIRDGESGAGPRLPIVALSGSASRGSRHACLAARAWMATLPSRCAWPSCSTSLPGTWAAAWKRGTTRPRSRTGSDGTCIGWPPHSARPAARERCCSRCSTRATPTSPHSMRHCARAIVRASANCCTAWTARWPRQVRRARHGTAHRGRMTRRSTGIFWRTGSMSCTGCWCGCARAMPRGARCDARHPAARDPRRRPSGRARRRARAAGTCGRHPHHRRGGHRG
ncbi:response regulator [Pseudoxanthomonas sp. NC8]|nr:response regulator [Pseudoxanthomonas sp. NC8]